MKATVTRCAASTRGRQRLQPSWMSPGLTSHQQLDAGIAARQHAGRKALKKSRRPFDNYFRTQFRFSPRVQLSVTQTSGVMKSYDAVRMMTDPRLTWSTPWDRGGSGARTRRKRQDVLEPTSTAFGEDSMDRVLERLVEIRFAWDREDGVLCTSLVPDSLYQATAHCRPYITEVAASPLSSSTALTPRDATLCATDLRNNEGDGEVIMIAGAPVRIQRRTPVLRLKSGQPKRPHAHSSLGFSGVDTVPSLVLDVTHGPFVTAPSAQLMTLRWKGEHREAASAQSALQLLRRVRGVPVVGLAPRSSFFLLKALSTMEVEEPALAVSVAIATGENYNGYSDSECLEALRCLRRLAFVRGLPELATPDIKAAAVSSAGGAAALPRLYTEANLTDSMLSQYLGDAAPFLISKIWGRLPEQSRHLLQRGYFLDWFDLMRLAISASGSQRLPERLPNSITEDPYAAKYLFFHHTLGLKESVLRVMVAAMRGAPPCSVAASPASGCASDSKLHQQHTTPVMVANTNRQSGRGESAEPRAASSHFIDEVKEEVDKPLVLWLCASLLVRIVAESLGDVVRHVGDFLHQHAALAAERAHEQEKALGDTAREEASRGKDGPVSSLHELCHPYPRFSDGAYQQIGCRKPKRVRVRLLPFEAFPRVAQCFSCPYASVTEKVEAQERQRHDRARQGLEAQRRRHTSPSAVATKCASKGRDAATLPHSATRPEGREVQSTFTAVLAESPRMAKKIERTCAALTWSTAVLRSCRELVRDLPIVAPPPLSASARITSVDPAVSDALAARGEAEWARETVAMEVRHALCYRYVRSAVQLHMDALFVFLPWAEMEAQWEPMLTAGSDTGGSQDGDKVKETEEKEGAEGDGGFTADTLSAWLADAPAKATNSMDDSNTATAPLSQAEQRARAMMDELRECLEEFQVAVADVLEAHERFFEAPSLDTVSAPK